MSIFLGNMSIYLGKKRRNVLRLYLYKELQSSQSLQSSYKILIIFILQDKSPFTQLQSKITFILTIKHLGQLCNFAIAKLAYCT